VGVVGFAVVGSGAPATSSARSSPFFGRLVLVAVEKLAEAADSHEAAVVRPYQRVPPHWIKPRPAEPTSRLRALNWQVDPYQE
jgi:hypothetical protein